MIVTLSDGQPAELLRLLPWEFDDLRAAHLGDGFSFLYRFKVAQPSGRVVDDWIDTSEIITEPTPPDVSPEDDPAPWIDYRYQSDAWEWKQNEITPRLKAFEKARRSHVITQQPPEIRDRLKTAGDYALVIANAPIPEVTISIIADIAQRRFRFRFDGLGLIEAMERYGLIKGGDSSDDGYDLCRSWEYDCMRAWRMMPAEYAAIPLPERAAMEWAMQRQDIWQGLNSERDRMRRGL
jgi:hypothetical protein